MGRNKKKTFTGIPSKSTHCKPSKTLSLTKLVPFKQGIYTGCKASTKCGLLIELAHVRKSSVMEAFSSKLPKTGNLAPSKRIINSDIGGANVLNIDSLNAIINQTTSQVFV